MAVTVFNCLLLVTLIGASNVLAVDEKPEELHYNVPIRIRDNTYPIRDAYVQPIIQPVREGTYVQPVVQPSNQLVHPPQIIVVDDRSRNQVTPAKPTTVIDGQTRIGNTICVNRDEYEEFMGWKYGRNQGGSGDNGNRGNNGNYRRNGNYGRGGNYRRNRY